MSFISSLRTRMFCFVFCMFIFLGVLAKELLHSCFFFPSIFFGGPTIYPVWRSFFCPAKTKNQRSSLRRPSPGCLATCCCGCFQASGLRNHKPPKLNGCIFIRISRWCFGEMKNPPSFWLGFYRRLYGTSQVTLYCYIGIISSHYMDPHQPTIQLTLFPCEGIVLPPGCEASLMASAFSDKAIRQLPNQVCWILWEGRC